MSPGARVSTFAAGRRSAAPASTTLIAPGLLLSAAFLVPVKKGDAFRRVLGTQAESLAGEGLAISLSGPWPAYNFI